jgi:hypothetical protein
LSITAASELAQLAFGKRQLARVERAIELRNSI